MREKGNMSKVNTLLKLYDARDAMAEPDLEGKVDCSRGCSDCCYQIIGITMAEAIALSDFCSNFVRVYSETRGDVFEEARRLSAEFSATKFLSRSSDDTISAAWWKKREPCLFLDAVDGECTAYSYRPLVCRMHNSQDVLDCGGEPGKPVRVVMLHHDAMFVRLANLQWANMTAKQRTLDEYRAAADRFFLPAAFLWAVGDMTETELRNGYLTARAETSGRAPSGTA